jgi:NAD(P)-dependent dehydrogenase (short-subunit alcohol dehydrogenase family)
VGTIGEASKPDGLNITKWLQSRKGDPSAEIKKIGKKAIAVRADVSVTADMKRMVAEVEAQLGGVDILVNNAAIAYPRKLEEITETEWDEVLTVNLRSVFLVTQAVVGGMRQRKWGRIINLSSVAAQNGWGGGSALRCIQSRDYRSDSLLRLSVR